MTKIFKQLARHWAVCLVVFALLFVQAYCDLSLPDYTSRIVDTGIQQGGEDRRRSGNDQPCAHGRGKDRVLPQSIHHQQKP